MFRHKKTTAFIMSLLICASATALPVCSASATDSFLTSGTAIQGNEDTTSADTEAVTEATEDYLSSGDFLYEMTRDDTICIMGYKGSDTALVIPSELEGIAVTEIGEYAFMGGEFTSVTIPAGITYILENPFLDCASLKEIIVDEGNENYYSQDGVLFVKDEEGDTIACYPQGKSGKSYAIPEGVKKIGGTAVYGTQLEELTFPSTLEEIEHHGVSYNYKLKSADLSGTKVSYIGIMGFTCNDTLSDVKLPESLYDIDAAAFSMCPAIKEIELPSALGCVGQNAFAGTGLEYIKVPSSVVEIGYCAFGYDADLKAITDFVVIGDTGSVAHSYCTDSDEDYDYTNNFNFIDSADGDTYVESLHYEYVTSGEFTYAISGDEAYISACVGVGPTIEIPSEIDGYTVTKIFGGAFYKNQATKIVIPDTVTEIEDIAFYVCENLKEIVIPDSVKTIGNRCFADCTALETITIPAGVTDLGEEVVVGCTSLKEIKVAEGNTAFSAEDGVLYNSDKTVLMAYPTGKEDKSFDIPGTVKEIMISAFYLNTKLEKVDASSVETIGNYAFEQCTRLESVKLGKDLVKIGTASFLDCKSLLSMRIDSEKIKEIGSVAVGFYYDPANTEENEGYALIEGFRLHCPEDSGAYRYSLTTGVTAVTDTVGIFGYNVQKVFIYGLAGILGAIALAVIGVFTGKKIKKSKEQKKNSASVKKEKSDEKNSGKESGNEDNK